MMTQSRRIHGLRSAALALLGLLWAGTAHTASSNGLYRAQSCSAVRSRLVDAFTDLALRRYQVLERKRRPMLKRSGRPNKGLARSRASRPAEAAATPRPAEPAASAATGAVRGPSHFTGTNNQVEGVDEADRVKSDGRHIYTLSARQLLILKSWPAKDSGLLARFQIKAGFTPRSLFLLRDQLMVLSNGRQRRQRFNKRPQWWVNSSTPLTRVSLIDIRDRAAPKLVGAAEVEGGLLQARLIGGEAFLVTNDRVNLPPAFWNSIVGSQPRWQARRSLPWGRQRPNLAPTRAEMRRRVAQQLTRLSVETLFPTVTFYDGRQRPSTRMLHHCSDLYIPRGATQHGLLSLTRLSFGGGRLRSAGIIAGGQRVYASLDNLYVSTTAHRWHWQRRWAYRGTQIHKFSLSGRGPRYAASGVVPGYLLNQFSMDEHQNHLRVATTSNGWGWRRGAGSGNNLFVMRQSGRTLRVVGRVQGLAPGERIYAARMLGDRGYLVTFRRTDPLYTLDLSDPKEPRVMGELKVNGFSSYIHPLARGLLLTVGQDADPSGRVRGAHLQIFDVRNLRQPRRTQHYLLTEGFRSSSRAQLDHHAFTFDAVSGTLALPLDVQSSNRWSGVVLVKVDQRRGFRYLGAVDHLDLAAGHSRYPRVPIDRSIFIDRFAFTLSRLGLKAHDLGQGKPAPVASVRFADAVATRTPPAPRPWH